MSSPKNQGKLSFQRVAIINRGEPALRFLRTLREFNVERGVDFQGIAFYTESDEHAPFVRLADEAVALGKEMRTKSDGSLISAYCDHDFIVSLLKEHSCDAVWPGWGFVSEDPEFVARLEAEDITFIGPSSEAMFRLGDKIAAKYMAEACDVPLAPWAELTSADDVQTILQQGQRIGYPLMVKASAGGGGRGIIKVDEADDLLGAVSSVRETVAKIFGQGGILLEACVQGARHVEVQLVVNAEGESFALGVRDCSIQRKNQKVIEEAPSPILPANIEKHLCEVSAKLAGYAGYRGAGTAEYLYDPASQMCTFLEVNSRLQVEHTITELVFGCDLVKAQIDIALGHNWRPITMQARGHAIELRVNAENPEQGFQPSPGYLRIFRCPSGPGVRIDSGVMEGMEISPHFDSMIAKIIAWAPTRKQAIARALRACQELDAVVENGATNQAFLCDLLQHDHFQQGKADTAWLDRVMKEGGISVLSGEAEALISAAILESRLELHNTVKQFFTQAQDGIPQQIPQPVGQQVDFRLRNRPWQMLVYAIDDEHYYVGPNEKLQKVSFQILSSGVAELRINGQRHKILYSYGSNGIAVEVDGHTHPVERAAGGLIKASTPAVVVSIAVEPGDEVLPGDRLLTLEAMKMEMGVYAPEGGVVKSVLCRPNQQVSVGHSMMIIEPHGDAENDEFESQDLFPVAASRPLDALFIDGVATPEAMDQLSAEEAEVVMQDVSEVLRTVMLGYDSQGRLVRQVEELFNQDFRHLRHPARWSKLIDALSMFGDCGSLLNRNMLLRGDSQSAIAADVAFYDFCRRHYDGEDGAIPQILPMLKRALKWYGIVDLEPSDQLREALLRIAIGNTHAAERHHLCSSLLRVLMQLHEAGYEAQKDCKQIIERIPPATKDAYPFVRDNAVQADYVLFDRQKYALHAKGIEQLLQGTFVEIARFEATHRMTRSAMNRLATHPLALQQKLLQRLRSDADDRWRIVEALIRRLYIGRPCDWREDLPFDGGAALRFIVRSEDKSEDVQLLAILSDCRKLKKLLRSVDKLPPASIVEVVIPNPFQDTDPVLENTIQQILARFQELDFSPKKITFNWRSPSQGERHRTFYIDKVGIREDELLRDIHPEAARRVELWRLKNFHLQRLNAHDRVYAFLGRGRTNPKDERIFICAEVFAEISTGDDPFWEFEQAFFEALRALREAQSRRTKRTRFQWNWMHFYLHSPMPKVDESIAKFAYRLEPYTRELSVREVHVRARLLSEKKYEAPRNVELVIRKPGRYRLEMEQLSPPSKTPLAEMTPYDMRVVRAQRYGYAYPYEIIRMLEGQAEVKNTSDVHEDLSTGTFQEYDLNATNQLVPVDRPYGLNDSGVVVGIISNQTLKFPSGMARVWIGSDPTRSMGALAEPECRRIIAALDMAAEKHIPVEWIPVSAGAKIAMDSGTENLDWTALVLRKIVEFSQAGGQINIIVHGINVGAQSYWNAEATMLMHTRGILIMTLDGSMVLTGKKALDYSGGVSAEDERGIGGAERIMGPNGQAQYVAKNLGEAYNLIFDWYRFTYCHPQESAPRRLLTKDPAERSVLDFPYTGSEEFQKVGDIFDVKVNPGRKKPFAIRKVMQATIDQDGGYLERFAALLDGESSVVWDAHIGGFPVCLLGIESRSIIRRGRIPMDGPDAWTGGTLFPNSSRKVARAINSASGNRPVVVLANLSGFDGSPESMRKLQLELGAEIGRAVVNFEGPIIFVVIGRYHGGAYVVFSKALNPNLRAFAVQGSFASVIGGAPAAAVVFPREVNARVKNDPRVEAAERALGSAPSVDRPMLREQLDEIRTEVMLEKRGEVAAEFDAIHSVKRAVAVGSLDAVIEASELRGQIIAQLEEVMEVASEVG